MRAMLSSSRVADLPEQLAAWTALKDLKTSLGSDRIERYPSTVLLHGPTGTGKSFLVRALISAAIASECGWRIHEDNAAEVAARIPAPRPGQLRNQGPETSDDAAFETWLASAMDCDLWILDDLQHLPLRAVPWITYLLDERQTRGLATIVLSCAAPQRLAFRGERLPARLTTRLVAGLVVAVPPLRAPSRRRLLDEFCRRRQLGIAADVLDWLAQNLIGNIRQIEGAASQLVALAQLQHRPLALADIQPHFAAQVEATRPTVERIIERVSNCFRIEPRQLQSHGRKRHVLLPRQVGMYLARQLTGLSLERIGMSFGGHDHTTVRHACCKIAGQMKHDATLQGAIERLRSELV